jgi:hypothetical protein
MNSWNSPDVSKIRFSAVSEEQLEGLIKNYRFKTFRVGG